MSIYYKYAPYGSNIVLLSYVDDCVYWNTSKAPENGLWIIKGRDSMWTSWGIHIGSCQSECLIWRIIPFLWIRIDMPPLLLQNNWILPQLRQLKKFIITIYHLIWFSPKQMHITVMNKLRSWLGNSTFTTKIVLVHWFIYCLKELILVFKDPPPPGFVVRRLYTKSYCLKVYVLRGQFLTKKLSVPGGNFSNYRRW